MSCLRGGWLLQANSSPRLIIPRQGPCANRQCVKEEGGGMRGSVGGGAGRGRQAAQTHCRMWLQWMDVLMAGALCRE